MATHDDVIERCLLVKPEVFVYNIPPRQSARGYRAADWNLAAPNWTGRMRCVTLGSKLEIRLEDKTSGELFAACPVQVYPGKSVEPVTDSSRYFVICVQDKGRSAYIGIGFADRADSFDLNVTLQDHFKYLKKESEFGKEQLEAEKGPKLDLAFKAGQTIRINIPNKKAEDEDTKPKLSRGMGVALPGRILPPPRSDSLTPLQSPSEPTAAAAKPLVIGGAAPPPSNVDLLGDLVPLPVSAAAVKSNASNEDPWGDFASAGANAKSSGNWETF